MQHMLRLSTSQLMALTDVVTEHLRCKAHTEVFINCSVPDAPETTIGDLLSLLSEAMWHGEVIAGDKR